MNTPNATPDKIKMISSDGAATQWKEAREDSCAAALRRGGELFLRRAPKKTFDVLSIAAIGGFPKPCHPSGLQNSVSTPCVDLGCRKATFLPPAPATGSSLISLHPASRAWLSWP